MASAATATGPAAAAAAATMPRPTIDTTVPAINGASPSELDGTPITSSPPRHQGASSLSSSSGEALMVARARERARAGSLEEGGEDFARRKALLKERSHDPAVLVDLPTEPAVEQIEAALEGDRGDRENSQEA